MFLELSSTFSHILHFSFLLGYIFVLCFLVVRFQRHKILDSHQFVPGHVLFCCTFSLSPRVRGHGWFIEVDLQFSLRYISALCLVLRDGVKKLNFLSNLFSAKSVKIFFKPRFYIVNLWVKPIECRFQ